MPVYALGQKTPDLPTSGSYWVAPGAHIVGDVVLEEGVGVWFGAVLRGDNERITIGADTNLQEGVVCHTDLGFSLSVGARCTVGHRAILHGCRLGDQVLIGMGATVMNGAVIGADSMVGAGALVTEHKALPERSLIVGVPARVIRNLTDIEVDGLRHSAEHYVAAWRRFARDLRPLG